MAGATSAAGANEGGLEQRGLEGRRLSTRGGAFFSPSLACGTLVLGLLGGGCRPHVSVCDSDCDEALVPAVAGNGGGAGDADAALAGTTSDGPAGGAAGAAGAAAAECADDRDCDDGSFCNGAEQCRAGACVPGPELTCDGGTTCVEESGGAACVYADPSPWLVLLSNRQLVGLPTAELGKRALITLGDYPSNDLFVGFNEVRFSPDGRHALIDYLVPDFGQQVLELSFDEGVPKPVRPVKDLPNWGLYGVPAFSPDGARALVFEDGSGGYLLDLTGVTAVAASLSVPSFAGQEITFCQMQDQWVKAWSPSSLHSLASGELRSTPLDGDVVEVSPDRQRVWLRGEHARLVSCADGIEQGPSGLPDAGGTWSPDSRWLLASLDDGSGKLFSVTGLEATEVWSNAAVERSSWSADGRALLLRLVGETGPTFVYLDLTGDVPVEHALELPPDASVDRCSASGCLVFAPRLAEDGVDLLWQPFLPDAAASVLATQLSSESALAWADFAQNRLVLKRVNAHGGQLTLTDFEASPERGVFDWPGGSLDVTPASDGSGLLLEFNDDGGFYNFWLALPTPGAGSDAQAVNLDVPAYRGVFQPWPRQTP